jgi:hypothetical protein
MVCLAMNPRGNDRLAAMNAFARRVFRRMRVDADQPVQVKQFIGSYTSLGKESLPGDQADRILDELGIDPATFRRVPEDDEAEADHIFLLRHTLMNPWLLAGPERGRRSESRGGCLRYNRGWTRPVRGLEFRHRGLSVQFDE